MDDEPQKVGITERDDAGLHLGWIEHLDEVAFAILITKSLNDRFIEAVAAHSNKLIVHVTCTGLGGTAIEPKVHPLSWTRAQYDKLVKVIAPERTVLRVDPVIPTAKGLQAAREVLDVFRGIM